MKKILFTSILFLLPTSLLAEANVSIDEDSKTFLLLAPGTLSGNKGATPDADTKLQQIQSKQAPLRFKSRRDNRVDSMKFPQYGQVYGNRYNPWSEQESNRRLPPSLPPANPNFYNPWDLSGRMPAMQNAPSHPGTPYYSAGPQSYDQFSFGQGMPPDFPDSIYRDTNPASGPLLNGWMPGMGGDDFNLPFSPFKMF